MSSSDEPEDVFQAISSMVSPALAVAGKATPTQALRMLVDAYQQTRAVEEAEATRRKAIRAREAEVLADIEMRRAAILDYLDRSFDERRDAFAHLFDLADQAIGAGDTEALQSTLTAITSLASDSPFADVATVANTRDRLLDPDHEWTL
jgi:hypothetical protein